MGGFGAERTLDMQGRPLRETSDARQPRASALFGMFGGHVNVTDVPGELSDLPIAEPAATDAVRRIAPGLLDTELLTLRGGGSLLQIAAFAGDPGRAQLTALAEELARLFPRRTDRGAVRT
ncbi:hypothetical protein C5F59_036280 [Streptomyces sp. QL37]|uniref:hypothetical protein n=1 Tax=Streptomyces sp. QL37 TaxID=2093747 RepID=UPI0021CB157D|nr:hypothetical protein [Streptomyces sp. QL37]